MTGAVVSTGAHQPNGGGSPPYAAASSDLANQGQSTFTSLTQASGAAQFGSAVANLNDGMLVGSDSSYQNTSSAFDPADGSTVLLTLDTTANASGYNISSIVSYAAGLQQYRSDQDYTVDAFAVGSSTPVRVATIAYNPNLDGETTQVTTQNSGGFVATGVDRLLFTFSNGTGANAGTDGTYPSPGPAIDNFREFDVFGSAVPEPASFVSLAIGAAALLTRRRNP